MWCCVRAREIGGVGRFPAVTPCRIYIRRMDHPITGKEKEREKETMMGASVSRGVAADISLSLSPSLSVGISVVVARVRRARQQVVASRLQGLSVKAPASRRTSCSSQSRPCVRRGSRPPDA